MPDVVLTVTIPEAKVPIIQESFNATFEKEPGETDRQLFLRVLKNYVININERYKQRQASGGVARDETVVDVT